MRCDARESAVLLLYTPASGSDTGIVLLVPIIGTLGTKSVSWTYMGVTVHGYRMNPL